MTIAQYKDFSRSKINLPIERIYRTATKIKNEK